MRGINKVILMGNVLGIPVLATDSDSLHVSRFKLATTTTRKDIAGQTIQSITRHNLVAYGRLAEICGQYLEDGRPVYIEGQLAVRTGVTANGDDYPIVEVLVDTIQLLNKKQPSSSEEEG